MKTLLKFWYEGCAPCATLSRTMEDVDMSRYEVESVDIVSAPDVTSHYRIRAVPSLVIIDEEGNELKRHTGVMDKKSLQRWLDTE